MNASIPVYRADGSLYCTASEERLGRLQSAGLVARVVRHRKGHINRVILFVGPGEPSPILAGGLAGTRYSFREHLDSGYAVWAFKRVRPGEVPLNAVGSEGTPCPQLARKPVMPDDARHATETGYHLGRSFLYDVFGPDQRAGRA